MRPPFWSLLVVGARALHDDPLAARALTTLIGACTAPVVYLLARRVSGRRTGLVAGLILAFYPEHVGFSHYLWSECLFTLQIALVLLFLLRFLENGRRADLVLASSVAGIALVTKVFAVIVFAAMIATIVAFRRGDRVANAALASVLFLLPATVHSVVASRAAGRRIVLDETLRRVSTDARPRPWRKTASTTPMSANTSSRTCRPISASSNATAD